MKSTLKMVYRKGGKYWVGRLVDHPEVMSQGETLKELEENIIDAYRLLVLHEVHGQHEAKGSEANSARHKPLPRIVSSPELERTPAPGTLSGTLVFEADVVSPVAESDWNASP